MSDTILTHDAVGRACDFLVEPGSVIGAVSVCCASSRMVLQGGSRSRMGVLPRPHPLTAHDLFSRLASLADEAIVAIPLQEVVVVARVLADLYIVAGLRKPAEAGASIVKLRQVVAGLRAQLGEGSFVHRPPRAADPPRLPEGVLAVSLDSPWAPVMRLESPSLAAHPDALVDEEIDLYDGISEVFRGMTCTWACGSLFAAGLARRGVVAWTICDGDLGLFAAGNLADDLVASERAS